MLTRVLFLDDMPTRHEIIDAVHAHEVDEIVHVYTYDEAVRELSFGSFVRVFLDHDLSIQTIMCDPAKPGEEPTGTTLCLWIAAEVQQGRLRNLLGTQFVLHTMNTCNRRYGTCARPPACGMHSMKRILEDAGFDVLTYPASAMADHWRAKETKERRR